MKLGICRLCQKEKQLAHSHVFPEFFYEYTYDENHKYISASRHPRQKPKPFQKGLREYLLCLDCEAQINRYETYSVDILRNSDNYRTPDNKAIEIPNFDYRLFKLFGLSLIWRSHISSLYFFSGVNLGPHAEKIRRMIYEENPGEPFEYCFTLLKIDGPKSAKTIMHGPSTARFYNHKAYVFLAYGFEWTFIISSHSSYLTDEFPFVGVVPQLVILIEHKSQEQFIHDIGLKMRSITDRLRS